MTDLKEKLEPQVKMVNQDHKDLMDTQEHKDQ